ncbi:HAD-IIA family hydrolase [Jannaschia formosa]|uniref:HAD-IIA family hydrolase n=1 Tax=Jannaschia formosa TaxID=2259592 RepID=UPI000E1C1122|nr:HAD hydrolase-like protein [Jannaschia formosa]TFL17221.1 haloacid dehalogenase [Jannaschia formosa]
METVATIFDRYGAIGARLPAAGPWPRTQRIDSLGDIVDAGHAFVFDAYGVLNIGDRAIPGASERLDRLRSAGRRIRILSNAASYDHAGAVAKFDKLGIRVEDAEIVTSRDATLAHLDDRRWGCIAAPADDLSDLPAGAYTLGDDAAGYDRAEGFVFLSTETWTGERQTLLERSLLASPRPLVVANADLVAPRETGFSLEPGHFGHLLADRGIAGIRFFGKPFPEVFEMVEASLPGIAPDRIVMCGDTLHTDILGAAARGWRTVLVERDGLFSGEDAMSFCGAAGMFPDWRLPRI